MAKKEDSAGKKGFFDSFMEAFSASFITDTIRSMFEGIAESVGRTIETASDNIMKLLQSYVFMAFGALFVFVSLILLLNNYEIISYEWSILIAGIVMLSLSFFIRSGVEKNKR